MKVNRIELAKFRGKIRQARYTTPDKQKEKIAMARRYQSLILRRYGITDADYYIDVETGTITWRQKVELDEVVTI